MVRNIKITLGGEKLFQKSPFTCATLVLPVVDPGRLLAHRVHIQTAPINLRDNRIDYMEALPQSGLSWSTYLQLN